MVWAQHQRHTAGVSQGNLWVGAAASHKISQIYRYDISQGIWSIFAFSPVPSDAKCAYNQLILAWFGLLVTFGNGHMATFWASAAFEAGCGDDLATCWQHIDRVQHGDASDIDPETLSLLSKNHQKSKLTPEQIWEMSLRHAKPVSMHLTSKLQIAQDVSGTKIFILRAIQVQAQLVAFASIVFWF